MRPVRTVLALLALLALVVGTPLRVHSDGTTSSFITCDDDDGAAACAIVPSSELPTPPLRVTTVDAPQRLISAAPHRAVLSTAPKTSPPASRS